MSAVPVDMAEAHRRLVRDLRRFHAATAVTAGAVGTGLGAEYAARLAKQAVTLGACLDLLSDPGVYAIAVERRRQVEVEGYSTERDDGYVRGELAEASAAYARASRVHARPTVHLFALGYPPPWWPWAAQWWKPKSALRDVERAGALLAAEIGRLLRKAALEAAQEPGPENRP